MHQDLNPLEDLSGEFFVDRDKELETFWQWAMRMPTPFPHDSHALIGRRRTGKTSILVKLYNRLYHEQERVLPIFVSFARYLPRPEPQISWGEFAREYLAGYLRSYLAFRYRQPDLLKRERTLDELRPVIEQTQDDLARQLIAYYDQVLSGPRFSVTDLAQWIVNVPRAEANARNMPTVMIIDEFQVLTTAHNEERNIRWSITGLFQNAVETHWAPVLVSGSAVSTLVRQALGNALAGRFHYHFIEPLPQEHAYDLAFRLGRRFNVAVNEALAEAIWQISAGYPYSIEALLATVSPAKERYPALAALEAVVNFELSDSNGLLRQHYQGEFDKYATQLNGGQLIRKVMFWVTKYPNQDVRVEPIARDLGATEEEVEIALDKLYQIDIIDKVTWGLYTGPTDPMLRRYIEYTYRRSIDQLAPAQALKDWQAEYASLRGELNRFIGEVGEVYLQGVMHRFDGRTVDGSTYFNRIGPVLLPKFAKLERRSGIVKGGVPIEIDLQGEWTEQGNTRPSLWLVQVKHRKTPVGAKEVSAFLQQGETLAQLRGYANITCWFFSRSGFTRPALKLLQQAGILYSDLPAFNQLARLFDFFGLPE